MKEFYNQIVKLEFLTIEELYEGKEEYRKRYRKLDFEVKQMYKWYFFYQLCLLRNPLKELMWDYLNKEELDCIFMIELAHSYNQFILKKQSMKRRKEEEEVEEHNFDTI